MSIRPLLKQDLDHILEYIKIVKQIKDPSQFLKISYALQNDENGNFQYELLKVGKDYIIDPAHYRAENNLTSNFFKRFKALKAPGYFSVDSDKGILLPHLHTHLGYSDFKISVGIEDSSLHEEDKPITYKQLTRWEGQPWFDQSADYTFLVKDFRIMQDFIGSA